MTCRPCCRTRPGDLVGAEVAVLERLTDDPARPYVVVLGGAKPSDKLAVIDNLLDRADRILIGGGMSYTFLKAKGYEVGKSLLEADQIDDVTKIMAAAASAAWSWCCRSTWSAPRTSRPTPSTTSYPVTAFPADREGVDIGPATRELFAAKLADAATVFWNGPVGVFEFPAFSAGTRAVAEAIAALPRPDGGGRRRLGGRGPHARLARGGFSHISTGGAQAWSTWRARPCPASPRWRLSRLSSVTRPRRQEAADGRQLEDEQQPLRGHRAHPEAGFSLTDKDYAAADVVVLPPFTALRSVQTLIDGDKLQLLYGAQDVSPHEDGAYTGDISARMLAKLGCQFVLAGHSERRQYHHEDDALVNAKVRAIWPRHDPILCVGESLEVRQAGDGRPIRWPARRRAGRASGRAGRPGLVVAYEPVWAIGTGEVATPADAQEVCGAIRARISAVSRGRGGRQCAYPVWRVSEGR